MGGKPVRYEDKLIYVDNITTNASGRWVRFRIEANERHLDSSKDGGDTEGKNGQQN